MSRQHDTRPSRRVELPARVALVVALAANAALSGCAGGSDRRGEPDPTGPDTTRIDTTTTPTGPTRGAIAVITRSSGPTVDFAGRYTLTVDDSVTRAPSANGTMVLEPLAAGTRRVSLGGVPANCMTSGGPTRSVTVVAGDTADVHYEITCTTPMATLRVTTATAGEGLDPDGYAVAADGVAPSPIAVAATREIAVRAGEQVVTLDGVAWNCSVVDGRSRIVFLDVNGTVDVRFDVTCRVPRPPSDAALVIESFRNGFYGLHLLSADGRRSWALPSLGIAAQMADWSPDGTRISYRDQGTVTTWIAGADGSAPTRLPIAGRYAMHARWSPDGQWIAFNASEVSSSSIHVIRPDGTGERVVAGTESGADLMMVDWSPDGRRLVFVRNDLLPVAGTNEYRRVSNLWVVDVAGGTPVRLTANTDCGDSHPSWSPDGTRIAYASCSGGTRVAIWAVDPDGQHPVRLTSGQTIDYAPAWSPDGRRIAYQSEASGNRDVWVMNADGTGAVNLTADNAQLDGAPRWRRGPVTGPAAP